MSPRQGDHTSIEDWNFAFIRFPKVFTLVQCPLRTCSEFLVRVDGVHCEKDWVDGVLRDAEGCETEDWYKLF